MVDELQASVPVPLAINVTFPPEHKVFEDAVKLMVGDDIALNEIMLLVAVPQALVTVAVIASGMLTEVVLVLAPVLHE